MVSAAAAAEPTATGRFGMWQQQELGAWKKKEFVRGNELTSWEVGVRQWKCIKHHSFLQYRRDRFFLHRSLPSACIVQKAVGRAPSDTMLRNVRVKKIPLPNLNEATTIHVWQIILPSASVFSSDCCWWRRRRRQGGRSYSGPHAFFKHRPATLIPATRWRTLVCTYFNELCLVASICNDLNLTQEVAARF